MSLPAFLSTYDLPLFAAASLVSLLFCGVALLLPPGRPAPRTAAAIGRVAAGGTLLGVTVWGVFFLTWKGFFPFVAASIPASAMATSLVLAIMGATAALAIAVCGDPGLRGTVLAGSILAASASCLLFVAMSALAAPLTLGYDLSRVLLAMIGGTLLCSAGLHQLRHAPAGGRRRLLPGALVALMPPLLDIASLSAILPFTEWETAAATPGALALQPLTVVFLSELAAILALTRAGAAVDRQSASRARRENERLRQLTDSTFEGLLVHRDGVVLDANTAFCAMAGLPLNEVKGRPVADFAPAFSAPAFSGPALSGQGGTAPVEGAIAVAGGEPLPVEMLSRAINLGDGQVEVTAVRDIRERRAAERSARDRQRVRDLQRETDEARERQRIAEEASRAKSAFLAMMSHEIRTPMNAVLGLTATLLEERLTAEQRGVVRAIHTSGDSLLRILNDILDFSRLDAGRMTFEYGAFSPATLTQQTLSVHGPVAVEKGVFLEVMQDSDMPARVVGDAGRIGQVLHNLVSNAIKFTRTGGVTVHARRVATESDDIRPGAAEAGQMGGGMGGGQTGGDAGRAGSERVTIEWTVTDTGIGIAPEKLGSLFDAFVQADTSITRRFGGSGLGLAISRQLVDRMGGTIGVTSIPGVGSTFKVRLTLRLAADREAARPEPPADDSLARHLASRDRPLRLLLAEDNAINKLVFSRMLAGLPILVDIADNGNEAVRAAERTRYDLICMDMSMPEMDGLEATRAIRRGHGPCRAAPIVAMTANAFPEDVTACLNAGMNDFVSKPIGKPTLLNAILRALAPGEERPARRKADARETV